MTNFIMLDSKTLQLPSGVFGGVSNVSCFATGELEGIRLTEKNVLPTQAGGLIPACTETARRKNKYSVEFYKSGMVKAVALDAQQEIKTPIGTFPAELATFYESGELKRFFPLDGKISGFWTEAEERKLAEPFSFDLGFTRFSALINGVAFHRSGALKSVTLQPGELIDVKTIYGTVLVRNGFSLYETGELDSLEPAYPVPIDTPIGRICAYDPSAVGLSADICSLAFEPDGRVRKIATSSTRLTVTGDDGPSVFEPIERPDPMDDDRTVVEGFEIRFDYESEFAEILSDGISSTYPMDPSLYSCVDTGLSSLGCSSGNCASCGLCPEA
ncbi:MAG: hypothetical protein LBT59_16105 [Clostridiales bacterium]|jgi:hypothetical protein|nr:hypothetical protein [Clostridiales bacterium]